MISYNRNSDKNQISEDSVTMNNQAELKQVQKQGQKRCPDPCQEEDEKSSALPTKRIKTSAVETKDDLCCARAARGEHGVLHGTEKDYAIAKRLFLPEEDENEKLHRSYQAHPKWLAASLPRGLLFELSLEVATSFKTAIDNLLPEETNWGKFVYHEPDLLHRDWNNQAAIDQLESDQAYPAKLVLIEKDQVHHYQGTVKKTEKGLKMSSSCPAGTEWDFEFKGRWFSRRSSCAFGLSLVA